MKEDSATRSNRSRVFNHLVKRHGQRAESKRKTEEIKAWRSGAKKLGAVIGAMAVAAFSAIVAWLLGLAKG